MCYQAQHYPDESISDYRVFVVYCLRVLWVSGINVPFCTWFGQWPLWIYFDLSYVAMLNNHSGILVLVCFLESVFIDIGW
jgi:hypothetical protein